MTAVRSHLLGWADALAGTPANLYTSPAGVTTIVKSISLSNESGSANAVKFTHNRSGSELYSFRVHLAAAGTDGDAKIVLPWIVLEPGDYLGAYAGLSYVTVGVSGAELGT